MPAFIRFAGRDTLSLRQVDELNRVPKGTAFRHFKAVREQLREGADFFDIDAREHAAFIAGLRADERIYLSTNHLVLLTESGYRLLLNPGNDRLSRLPGVRPRMQG